jgi:hypothetical protein
MQHSNIGLRIALGLALLSFFLPFVTISTFLVGTESWSGLSMAFEASEITFVLIVLIVAFILSFNKKPLGRWIGTLPLLSALILLHSESNPSWGNGFTQIRLGVGLHFCLLASIAALILGFMGESSQKLNSLFMSSKLSLKKDLPLDVENQAAVAKVLNGHKLIVLAIVLLLVSLVSLVVDDKQVSIVSWWAAVVIGIFALLRVGAILRYEVPTLIVVSICILLPLFNLFTLTVLAIKIGLILKSNGIQVGSFKVKSKEF